MITFDHKGVVVGVWRGPKSYHMILEQPLSAGSPYLLNIKLLSLIFRVDMQQAHDSLHKYV